MAAAGVAPPPSSIPTHWRVEKAFAFASISLYVSFRCVVRVCVSSCLFLSCLVSRETQERPLHRLQSASKLHWGQSRRRPCSLSLHLPAVNHRHHIIELGVSYWEGFSQTIQRWPLVHLVAVLRRTHPHHHRRSQRKFLNNSIPSIFFLKLNFHL